MLDRVFAATIPTSSKEMASDFDESIQNLKNMFPDYAEDYLTNIFLFLNCNLEESIDSILNTPPPASQKEYSPASQKEYSPASQKEYC